MIWLGAAAGAEALWLCVQYELVELLELELDELEEDDTDVGEDTTLHQAPALAQPPPNSPYI